MQPGKRIVLRIRAWIRFIFGFSQTEANAFLILLPLIMLILVCEPVYQTYIVSNKPDNFHDHKMLDSLLATLDWSDTVPIRNSPTTTGQPTPVWKPRHFDPNTITSPEMIAMGIPPRVATGMVRYREKGGRFRIRKDLKKMYGLDSGLYRKLEAWILLPENYPTDTTQRYVRRPPTPLPAFDLNEADTVQLAKVYGIGPATARRIDRYRTSLGGFLSYDQLYEVWGLDTAVVRRLTEKSVIAAGFTPKRLAINTETERELARHPYVRTKLARAIVNYRFQHGKFTTAEDLKKIALIDEKAFLRIKPYITLE